jgi:hypothetical protein
MYWRHWFPGIRDNKAIHGLLHRSHTLFLFSQTNCLAGSLLTAFVGPIGSLPAADFLELCIPHPFQQMVHSVKSPSLNMPWSRCLAAECGVLFLSICFFSFIGSWHDHWARSS